jgi:hypothetical protein
MGDDQINCGLPGGGGARQNVLFRRDGQVQHVNCPASSATPVARHANKPDPVGPGRDRRE